MNVCTVGREADCMTTERDENIQIKLSIIHKKVYIYIIQNKDPLLPHTIVKINK